MSAPPVGSPKKPKPIIKRTTVWLSVIGSIASVVSLAIIFVPTSQQKDAPRQDVRVGQSGIAGVSNSGNVNITVNPGKPEAPVFKQPGPFPGEIDYRDLASPALSANLIGKTVIFRALFLSEWNITSIYGAAGIPISSRLFLNHRSVSYKTSDSPLGGSDSEIPPFPLQLTPEICLVFVHCSMVTSYSLPPT